MRIDREMLEAIQKEAARLGVKWEALGAFVLTESGGQKYAVVNGKKEPLIRFEGHYFDRFLSGTKRETARKQGLSSPEAGRVKNPGSQDGRWALLRRAMKIDKAAALSSMSWGVGQVMGSHWQWLGFSSVDEFVEVARSGINGQVHLMGLFIEKASLKSAIKNRKWATAARKYNGPGYRKNKYDQKMAANYRKLTNLSFAPSRKVLKTNNGLLQQYQEKLIAIAKATGDSKFNPGAADGLRGPKTTAAVKYVQQQSKVLSTVAEKQNTWGSLGPMTRAWIDDLYNKPQPTPKPTPKPPAPAQSPILQRGARGDQVMTLQRYLMRLGYLTQHEIVFGSFGQVTEGAVRRFQSDNGLVVDGIVGKNTARKLVEVLKRPPQKAAPQPAMQVAPTPPSATLQKVKPEPSPVVVDAAAPDRMSKEKLMSGIGAATVATGAASEVVSNIQATTSSLGDWFIPMILVAAIGFFGFLWYRRDRRQKRAIAELEKRAGNV